ncbi:phage terminase large subunit [Raineya sp.]
MIEINFKPSPKQYIAWQYLEDAISDEVFYGGAAGGGKTLLGCVWHIYRRLRYSGSRGLIGRNELKAITESTLITLKDVAREFGLIEGRHFRYDSIRNVINWYNGSRTILKELKYQPSDPDFQTLGSMEYTDAFIDEAPEITEKAFEIVKSRVRYRLVEFQLTPKVLLTGNPGPHWVKNRFVKDKNGSPVVLKPNQKFVSALLIDNPNKDFVELYRKNLEAMKSEYDKQRLLYGNWDAEERTGGEFYKSFDTALHIAEIANHYNPLEPLHITFDFNVVPYITACVWQVFGKKAFQITEFCLESPNNTTPKLCKAILKHFREQQAHCYIYGDPAGQHRDTRNDKNDFDIILQELSAWRPKKRVASSAPSVAMRGEFINEIFANSYAGISIVIDKKCQKTIQDYQNIKENPDGTKNKKRVTDPKTKVNYEALGHTSDANDYFLCEIFKDDFRKFFKKPNILPTAVSRPLSQNVF